MGIKKIFKIKSNNPKCIHEYCSGNITEIILYANGKQGIRCSECGVSLREANVKIPSDVEIALDIFLKRTKPRCIYDNLEII